MNCCVPTVSPFDSYVLYPVSWVFSVYVPGGTAGKLYCPTSFVTVSREMFVASFVSETVTPGMTPLGSRTSPRTPPVNCCALTDAAAAARSTALRRTPARRLIVPSPTKRSPGHDRANRYQSNKYVKVRGDSRGSGGAGATDNSREMEASDEASIPVDFFSFRSSSTRT